MNIRLVMSMTEYRAVQKALYRAATKEPLTPVDRLEIQHLRTLLAEGEVTE